LREREAAAYARLASDLVAFKELLRAHASPDKPRPGAGEAPRERLGEQLLDAVEANYRAAWPAGVAAVREENLSSYVRFHEC
jgi:hypothetical protein